MKRRTFISLMSVMAAAGVLSLAGCSSNTSASTASSTAASASAAAANKLETIQSNAIKCFDYMKENNAIL